MAFCTRHENKCFSSIGPSIIVCIANVYIGEIHQFGKLDDQGQSLMRWQSSICQQEPIIVFSSWRARLRIWRRRCTLRSRPKLMMW